MRNYTLIIIFSISLLSFQGAIAYPGHNCNPNLGNVKYHEPSETDDGAFENWADQLPANDLLGAVVAAPATDADVGETLDSKLGTGQYNDQVVPLTAREIDSLVSFRSRYVDNHTILIVFLSNKSKGQWLCNAVRHRLFTGKVTNLSKSDIRVQFGGHEFDVSRAALGRGRLFEVTDVPPELSGRIFAMSPDAFRGLHGTTIAYDRSYAGATDRHKADILEAYLAIGVRHVRMARAHQIPPTVKVSDDDINNSIKVATHRDCVEDPAQEICVFSKALKTSEAEAPDEAFKLTDAVFNNSGITFGWQQLDMAVDHHARLLAEKYFPSRTVRSADIKNFEAPIRVLPAARLKTMYDTLVPEADDKLNSQEMQQALVSDYVSYLQDELASATPMNRLPATLPDDDRRLVRLLQADRLNVGGDKIAVAANAASICDVVNATPDRRYGGERHQRWINIVRAYNVSYATNISTCNISNVVAP